MVIISKEEEDTFANYSSRLTEIEEQLDLLLKQTNLIEIDKELVRNLTLERNQIANWFIKTAK